MATKEVLTVFLTWDGGRSTPVIQAVKGPKARYVNDSHLLPRSSYRKALGDGVRTITYGAHTPHNC